MPHSTQASIATQNNYSVDRPLTATSVVLSHSAAAKLVTGNRKTHQSARSIDSNRVAADNSWKRSSLVVADAYASLIGTGVHSDRDTVYEMPERNSVNYGGDGESKRRTQYYNDAFEYKANAQSSARDKVQNESPVVAELRTNVIIKDEFTLVTDLSYHLAARYTRPDSSIMINIDHSACLALAGTFEPCYILTITTLPSQMQPVTNKRNAALIQAFMADILSVPPDRGIVKFTPIPEENLAINGNTILGEIERLEKAQSGDTAIKRSISDARKSIPGFSKKSTSKLETIPSSQPNGVSETIKQTRRRSNTASPTPSSPVTNVFELADGTAKEEERPTTASGSYAALNGLRLNGVSNEDLGSRLPNGRPKTFSGVPAPQDSHENEPIPEVKAERRKSAIPTSPKPMSNPLVPKISDRPTSGIKGTSTPTQRSITSTTTKVSSTQKSAAVPSAARTAATKAAAAPPPDVKDNRDPAANTAKRRLTVQTSLTATPKMPPPPPVPESRPQLKMSKRKSFLSAFRR